MIYHYCNRSVFCEIVKTKIIFLSDITKMNDSGEYQNGFQIIREILSQYPDIDNAVVTQMSPENLNLSFKVFAACFSKNGDLHDQWISYADGVLGFSIGFDPMLIEQHHTQNRFMEKMQLITTKVKLTEVAYDKENFKEEVHQQINLCRNSESPIKWDILADKMMMLAIKYKDKFYEKEQETRAFIAPKKNIPRDDFFIEQRIGVYGTTAFHRLNTSFQNFHSIKEIIIGPQNPLAIERIRSDLGCYGLGDISIKYSEEHPLGRTNGET